MPSWLGTVATRHLAQRIALDAGLRALAGLRLPRRARTRSNSSSACAAATSHAARTTGSGTGAPCGCYRRCASPHPSLAAPAGDRREQRREPRHEHDATRLAASRRARPCRIRLDDRRRALSHNSAPPQAIQRSVSTSPDRTPHSGLIRDRTPHGHLNLTLPNSPERQHLRGGSVHRRLSPADEADPWTTSAARATNALRS
jgi:hypothetical protein